VSWASFWPEADVARMAADVRERSAAAVAAWELTGLRELGRHVAVVHAAERAGRAVVLKLNPRGHREEAALAQEAEALARWQSSGAVPELIDVRDEGLTLLLEFVPGGDASGLGFEERLDVLGALAARLHAADASLIHGDLHGGNALWDGASWRAIDPKGTPEDRHYDIWALIDPSAPRVPDAATARRWIERYAGAASLDPDRAAHFVRARAREVAAEIDDPGWAARLRRMAELA
jgi:tRNA A-37 threonylcarbamoyl transferase component Bud32